MHTKRDVQPSITFEKAADFRYDQQFPDGFILGALAEKLGKQGGKKENTLKSFLDRVPMDASDREFSDNHAEIIRFRDELTDFVGRNLVFAVPPHYNYRDVLSQAKVSFVRKLQDDKQKFRAYVRGREQGLSLRENRAPMSALDFHGCVVRTPEGDTIDLLEDKVQDVQTSLYMQRDPGGLFVHWRSKEYMAKKASGHTPKLDKRIYLNPRPQDAVGIFQDIVDIVNDNSLTVKAKVLDQTNNSEVMTPYSEIGDKRTVRADGIVISVGERDADTVLGLIEQLYFNHRDSFKGRQLPSVPLKVGEGFGLGDEPLEEGASLTSHRAGVLERVLKDVREVKGTNQERIHTFRRLWRTAALAAQINPDNIAFNKPKSK